MMKWHQAWMLAAAMLLTACGGGGHDRDETSFQAKCPDGSIATSTRSLLDAEANCPTQGDLATSVPAPTYAAGSNALYEFQALNRVRLAGGFGGLSQSALLDTAALNHAKYIVANFMGSDGFFDVPAIKQIDPATGLRVAYVEDPQKPLFTGVRTIDRGRAAGYAAAVATEGIGLFNGAAPPTSPLDCVANMLDTVFLRSALLQPDLREIGISMGTIEEAPPGACVILAAATSTNRAVAPSGWVGVYPSAGQVDLPTLLPATYPDPVPGAADKGYPATVIVGPDKVLGVTAFTIKDPTGRAVPAKLVTAIDFPVFLTRNTAHLVPTEELNPMTTYTVHFAATVESTADGSRPEVLTKDWSFTTR